MSKAYSVVATSLKMKKILGKAFFSPSLFYTMPSWKPQATEDTMGSPAHFQELNVDNLILSADWIANRQMAAVSKFFFLLGENSFSQLNKAYVTTNFKWQVSKIKLLNLLELP